jgi:hypothetical protein
MTEPIIELITNKSGDWKTLRLNLGEDMEFGSHSIPCYIWIKLLKQLGYKVIEKEISDENMENENYE